jgi:hypothetical protein
MEKNEVVRKDIGRVCVFMYVYFAVYCYFFLHYPVMSDLTKKEEVMCFILGAIGAFLVLLLCGAINVG